MKADETLLKVDSWRIKIEDRDEMINQAFESTWAKNSVRVYECFKEQKLVALQLRTHAPITRRGRKPRHMLAHVALTTEEAKELIRALTTIIAECQG